MSGYTLTWKANSKNVPLTDGSVFRPDTLCGLDADAVARVPLRIGRADAAVGDYFRVRATEGRGLVLNVELGDGLVLNRIGAGMRHGVLEVRGNAGDDLGASMRGGSIRVHGSAGHRVGGPDAPSDRGMTGGRIVVESSAGDFVGLRMRRGLIAVGGRTGRSPGYRMLAGTIAVGRGPFDDPGLEMRRGTLCLLDPQAAPLASPAFAEEGVFDAASFPVLGLMLWQLELPQIFGDKQSLPERFRLYSGDRFELNKGEIWQWVS
jgi:formylmethanofuran dehydrogenase subunit C